MTDGRIAYHGTRVRIVKLWRSNGYLGPPSGGLRFTFNPKHALIRTTVGADQFYLAHLHQILGDKQDPGIPVVIEIDLDKVTSHRHLRRMTTAAFFRVALDLKFSPSRAARKSPASSKLECSSVEQRPTIQL